MTMTFHVQSFNKLTITKEAAEHIKEDSGMFTLKINYDLDELFSYISLDKFDSYDTTRLNGDTIRHNRGFVLYREEFLEVLNQFDELSEIGFELEVEDDTLVGEIVDIVNFERAEENRIIIEVLMELV